MIAIGTVENKRKILDCLIEEPELQNYGAFQMFKGKTKQAVVKAFKDPLHIWLIDPDKCTDEMLLMLLEVFQSGSIS